MRRCVLVAFVLSIASGCAYRTPPVNVPPAMPPIGAHQLEADVTVVDGDTPLPEEVVFDVRKRTDELLRSAAARRRGSEHARVRVHVVIQDEVNGLARAMSHDGMAALAAPTLLLGFAYERATIAVDVRIETDDGCAFTGHGEAEKDGSIYARARRRALAAALDRALTAAALDAGT